jgi:chemotaxis family two-component system sensor kinase Cph1
MTQTPLDSDNILLPENQVSLTNCDKEPIHIPGAIQPHGALLVLSPDGRILHQSANLYDLLDVNLSDLVGDLIAKVNTDPDQKSFYKGQKNVIEQEFNNSRFTIAGHRMEGSLVFEFEPLDENQDFGAFFDKSNQLMQELSKDISQEQAYQSVVNKIRDLIGFDRVMAYVFDSDGHGSVIAESLADNVDGFQGLHFPATDIPAQARRLYTLELTRQIVDVNYTPVSISPTVNSITGRPFNMAYCSLRSISPIHIQYLQNMGVSASYSISIVAGNDLIALIACHHLSPRHLNYYQRRGTELFARVLSEHFVKRQIEYQIKLHDEQLNAQVKLICELGDTENIDANNQAWDQALPMLPADSLLVKLGGEKRIIGHNPSDAESIWPIGDRMALHEPNKPSSSRNITEFNTSIEGGGLLIVPIDEENWIGWYRLPENKTINWAGKPTNKTEGDLTPRKSFETWQESIHGFSSQWTDNDLNMADLLSRGLSARIGGKLPSEQSFEQVIYRLREYILYLQDSNRMLSNLNDDLRQFTDITSHDMRAPLRTIASFLPLIRKEIEEDLSDQAKVWMRYLDNSVATMQRLLEGIWNYSVVGREINAEEVDLNELTRSIIDSLAEQLEDADVFIDNLPKVSGISNQIEALVRNLVNNATKYKSENRKLKLVISSRFDGENHIISVSDNGIGFPPHANEQIFDLFSRLHHDRAEGDGLGLALCRRIVHHHRGWIRAESEVDKGSIFEFIIREPKITSANSQKTS